MKAKNLSKQTIGNTSNLAMIFKDKSAFRNNK